MMTQGLVGDPGQSGARWRTHSASITVTHVYQFSEWGGHASGQLREFSLMSRGEERRIRSLRTGRVLLTNRDYAHLYTEQMLDEESRRAAHHLADTKLEHQCMTERRGSLFSVFPELRLALSEK